MCWVGPCLTTSAPHSPTLHARVIPRCVDGTASWEVVVAANARLVRGNALRNCPRRLEIRCWEGPKLSTEPHPH